MENASKALIIAGAILLSILLISLGILIYNNAKGTVDDADMSEYQIQVFNEKFSSFIGENKTSYDIKDLIQTAYEVRTSGESSTGMKTLYVVTGDTYPLTNYTIANYLKTANNVSKFINKDIKTGQQYKVQALYENRTTGSNTKYRGLIRAFYISPKPW